MTNWLFNQYQIKTEAPPAFITAVPQFESAWHQPWSEPVRKRIIPALAVALAASGVFAPPFSPDIEPGATNAAPWIYPWSEPVRFRSAIRVPNQPFFAYGNQKPEVSFSYYNWLTTPVRLKRGIGSHLQQFDPLQVPVQPSGATLLQGWYNWFSEPVRQPKGLKPWLQQFFTAPPRYLPPAQVTMTLAATEINSDVALIGINVYSGSTPVTGVTSANVSISEIKAQNSGFTSIEET